MGSNTRSARRQKEQGAKPSHSQGILPKAGTAGLKGRGKNQEDKTVGNKTESACIEDGVCWHPTANQNRMSFNGTGTNNAAASSDERPEKTAGGVGGGPKVVLNKAMIYESAEYLHASSLFRVKAVPNEAVLR